MNRFEWDLRYPDARGLPGRTYLMGGSLRGPVAVPGTYRARLRVGQEVSKSQSFEIHKDPRIATTPEEFQEQFDLLLRIRDRLSKVHEAIASSEELKDELERLEGRATAKAELADVGRKSREITQKLQEVLDELYEPRFIGVDDQLLLFPLKLNARLASLGGVVASAETSPTAAAHEVFRDLSSRLDTELGKLQRIRENDLAALNRLAQERGMAVVSSMLRFGSDLRGSRR